MGRLILIALIVVAVVLLWKAFGPGTWNRPNPLKRSPQPPAIKGPDDDPDFLWNIDKQRFKERRAREQAEEAKRKEERRNNRQDRDKKPEDPTDGTDETGGEA
ncbi:MULTISPECIES: hypothetical protein [unclassified Corynebacterium]|uniref:hypothetical protein n=1 Tax=unclassified Corynebacterium TaxID=2624378 RepID=UPI0029CA2A97|nr:MULTISPECIES: hypothetical protein [unclassified Corynebacterium]WPF66425.1 hypothetical protein OLX12_01470 [Corynebacterium sp. 22KM0430]WPF68915.1 hypothetical protein OLW90_01470 [Corynebacterium sp. 21KM1197]